MQKRIKNPYEIPENDLIVKLSSPDELLESLSKTKNIENIKYIDKGSQGLVFYFNLLSRSFVFNNILLNKEEYIIKFNFINLDEYKIIYLKTLSRYGLIPKIYYINSKIIIMKFIKGITFKEYKKINTDHKIRLIKNKIFELEKIWKKLGFNHGDLDNSENILVTPDNKVYIIDPR